jgi:5-methylcytosine-specific restriction endonuclease McrA
VRVCSGAGCLRAVQDDVSLCDECRPQRSTTDEIRVHTLTDRERYAAQYSSPRWQRLRVRVVKEQPLCARCQLHITEIVDHVVPAGFAIAQARDSGKYRLDSYAGFFFRSNLQGLCRPCHYVKTVEDKAHLGAWPDVVLIELNKVKRKWTF